MSPYLSHLEALPGGEKLAADAPRNSGHGTVLFARYDLARMRRELPRESIEEGPTSLWRYAPLLPIADLAHAVTLGEGFTPLLRTERLGRVIGSRQLWVKDEGRNPSGTFKDRGAAVAVSRYREMGVNTVALSSSGNAGGSWALYCARAGLTCVSVLPTDAQPSSVSHCASARARTFFIEDWHRAGRVVSDACALHGWFNVNTLAEPYRLEGKKTMGFDIAEQLGWQLPDVVVYPMGGGLGAIAIWKAFAELLALGWVAGQMPRLIVTQYAGCAPVVKAFDEGKPDVEPWRPLDVPPGGLKSPHPPGGRLVLELIRKHGGGAIAVTTDEAIAAVSEMAAVEGIFSCPESATTLVGVRKALARGLVHAEERIVLVNTGSGLKSIPTLPRPDVKTISSAAEIGAA